MAELAPCYVASVRACCVKSCGPVCLTRTSQHGVVGRKQEGLFKLPLAFSKTPNIPVTACSCCLATSWVSRGKRRHGCVCISTAERESKHILLPLPPLRALALRKSHRHVKEYHTPPGPSQHHPKTRHMERMIRIIYCWHICLLGKQHTDSLCCLYRSFSQSSIRKMT